MHIVFISFLMWAAILVIGGFAAFVIIAAIIIVIEDAIDRYLFRGYRIPAAPPSRFALPPHQDK